MIIYKKILQKIRPVSEVVKNSYNLIAEEWNETRKNLHWEEFDFFYDKIPFKDGEKILDLGCGTGRLFDFLKSKGLKSENYVGSDFSEKMLEEARKNYPENKYFCGDVSDERFPFVIASEGVAIQSNDIEKEKNNNLGKNNLSLDKNGNTALDCHVASSSQGQENFDQIWCIAMFHHLSTKKQRISAIKNFHKILNKNGKIFLTVWNFYQEKNKFKKILKKAFWKSIFSLGFFSKKDCFFYWKNSDILRYYYAFEKDEIKKIFTENGFEIKFFDEGKNFSLILEKK